MNLAQMIAAAKTQAQNETAKPEIKAINPIVDKLLTEGVCISYKEAGKIGKIAGGNGWHAGIKFLSENGLGEDAQLLVMKDGAMPNRRNQARLTQFGYNTSGYTEVNHIALLEIIQQAQKEAPAAPAPAPAAPAKSSWLLV